MDDLTVPVTRVLFWILAVLSATSPMRWSIFFLILLSHVDATSASFESAVSVGWENAAKTLLLPSLLVFRFRRPPFLQSRWSLPSICWIILTLYAAVAVLWSPFQLSGLKMVGYFSCYIMLAVVFLAGWSQKGISIGMLSLALWVSLLMGAVQTFLLGNSYGRSMPGLDDDRFTSFCSPQLYGAFLLAILSVLMVSRATPRWLRILNTLGGLTGLLLCGSRYVFIGSIPLIVLIWFSYIARDFSIRARGLRLIGGMLGFLLIAGGTAVFFYQNEGSRIRQLVEIVASGDSAFEEMGTLVWRRGIYEQAIQKLGQRTPFELLIGSGTSSGASIVLGYDLRYTENRVDANRVVHNELVRRLDGWGFVG